MGGGAAREREKGPWIVLKSAKGYAEFKECGKSHISEDFGLFGPISQCLTAEQSMYNNNQKR